MPVVQYIVINREIVALGPGVLATQAAHASMAGYLLAAETEPARAWAQGTFTKIVLAVETEAALREVGAALAAAGITHKLIEESRLGGKATSLGVAPLERAELSKLLGHLAALK
jgi:peptidyl-tRNA hydrolase